MCVCVRVAGSLSALSGMKRMTILQLFNNQLTGVSPVVCCRGCVLVGCRFFRSTISILRVTMLFYVCGEAGSLSPLSGMTWISNLALFNNQLTGVSRVLVVSWTHACRISSVVVNCFRIACFNVV